MKTKKKAVIIIAVTVSVSLVACICLYIYMASICMKADELSQLEDWTDCITYSMLSDELKSVISEEEFNDRSDEGKYIMYLKLEALELEKCRKNDLSTDWWKTPPCDLVTIDGTKYFVEYRIDFRVNFNQIEVINFVTHLSEL